MSAYDHLPEGIRDYCNAKLPVENGGYSLASVFTQGNENLKVKIAVFKRPHDGTNEFATTDLLIISSNGNVSELSM